MKNEESVAFSTLPGQLYAAGRYTVFFLFYDPLYQSIVITVRSGVATEFQIILNKSCSTL